MSIGGEIFEDLIEAMEASAYSTMRHHSQVLDVIQASGSHDCEYCQAITAGERCRNCGAPRTKPQPRQQPRPESTSVPPPGRKYRLDYTERIEK